MGQARLLHGWIATPLVTASSLCPSPSLPSVSTASGQKQELFFCGRRRPLFPRLPRPLRPRLRHGRPLHRAASSVTCTGYGRLFITNVLNDPFEDGQRAQREFLDSSRLSPANPYGIVPLQRLRRSLGSITCPFRTSVFFCTRQSVPSSPFEARGAFVPLSPHLQRHNRAPAHCSAASWRAAIALQPCLRHCIVLSQLSAGPLSAQFGPSRRLSPPSIRLPPERSQHCLAPQLRFS